MELQPEILKKLQKKFKTLNSDISEIFVNVRNKIRYLDGASTRKLKKKNAEKIQNFEQCQ